MFNELEKKFEKVLKLADLKNKYYETYQEKYSLNDITIDEEYEKKIKEYQKTEEYKKYEESEKNLTLFMEGLDLEAIKIIRSIMYLGANGFEEGYDPFNEFKDIKNRLYNSSKNVDKDIEISEMVFKIPFNKFFRDGLEHLGIYYHI